jgi:hypothetical protein
MILKHVSQAFVMVAVETRYTSMARSGCSHAKGKTPRFSTRDLPQVSAARRSNQAPRIGGHVAATTLHACASSHATGSFAGQIPDSGRVTSPKQRKVGTVGSDKHPRPHSLNPPAFTLRLSSSPSTQHASIQRPRSPHFPPESALTRLLSLLISIHLLHPHLFIMPQNVIVVGAGCKHCPRIVHRVAHG